MSDPAAFAPRTKRVVRIVILVGLALLALPYLLTILYGGGQPVSTLMLWRWATGAPVSRTWIDIETIAPALPRSVVAAEDAKFCSHHGIDWDSVRDVIDDMQDGEASRGGSTITQQVAKNLFLWPGRSLIRKALEAPLALWIDFVLPKQRILEIYLNIAEWGPSGQFGAMAGADYAFGRSAAQLSAKEAALLAAILPNPHIRSAKTPGPGVRRLAATYVARARSAELRQCWRENRESRHSLGGILTADRPSNPIQLPL
ncbi:MAG: monofunctional biosynthetic peptidoglycan transglycosylase [Rhodopseudomonas sp.]|uniref:monofunctional biosynthetic peptidoglycan transglycosylase n=1 Tax=Rhodopseudomonas sp. TaxID=1078 RepID=UPI0039E406F6